MVERANDDIEDPLTTTAADTSVFLLIVYLFLPADVKFVFN